MKDTSRRISVICYDESLPDAIDSIIERNHPLHWAYIKHDRDQAEDGTFKKAHYHVILEFANARIPHAVAKRFGSDLGQPISSWVSSVRYLAHYDVKDDDSDGSFRYPIELIKSNFDLSSCFCLLSTSEKVRFVCDWLIDRNGTFKFSSDLLPFLLQYDLLNVWNKYKKSVFDLVCADLWEVKHNESV